MTMLFNELKFLLQEASAQFTTTVKTAT